MNDVWVGVLFVLINLWATVLEEKMFSLTWKVGGGSFLFGE